MMYHDHWHHHSPLPSSSSPAWYDINLGSTLEGTCPDIINPQGYFPLGGGNIGVYAI